MKKRIISTLIIITIASGMFFMLYKTSESLLKLASSAPKFTPAKPKVIATGKKAFDTIKSQGKNVKCLYDGSPELPILQAILYATNETTRIDIITMENGQIVTTSTLQNKDYFFIWANNRTTAMRVKNGTVPEKQKAELIKAVGANLDVLAKLNDNLKISCEEWQYDQSIMSVPTSKDIIDYEKMAEKIRNDKLAACKKCYEEEGVLKQQECRTTLSCSIVENLYESSESAK